MNTPTNDACAFLDNTIGLIERVIFGSNRISTFLDSMLEKSHRADRISKEMAHDMLDAQDAAVHAYNEFREEFNYYFGGTWFRLERLASVHGGPFTLADIYFTGQLMVRHSLAKVVGSVKLGAAVVSSLLTVVHNVWASSVSTTFQAMLTFIAVATGEGTARGLERLVGNVWNAWQLLFAKDPMPFVADQKFDEPTYINSGTVVAGRVLFALILAILIVTVLFPEWFNDLTGGPSNPRGGRGPPSGGSLNWLLAKVRAVLPWKPSFLATPYSPQGLEGESVTPPSASGTPVQGRVARPPISFDRDAVHPGPFDYPSDFLSEELAADVDLRPSNRSSRRNIGLKTYKGRMQAQSDNCSLATKMLPFGGKFSVRTPLDTVKKPRNVKPIVVTEHYSINTREMRQQC
eukprot:GHVQ01022923.1.p1 GENE.GHVQ01022923.1~~GHVQ01022923.1.p1  ORF type:complete len:404 (+),score=29.32 GHVQ01022923.1:186-1397(+)